MRTTRQMSFTLPNDMADVIKEKVKSGFYASESEVVREGLRALLVQERAVEAWMQGEVVATYDRMKANPERAVSITDLRNRLALKRDKAK